MSSLPTIAKRAGRGTTRPALRLLIPLVALIAPQAVLGHDFWVEPSTYRPEVASSVRLALRVGEDFAGKPFPRLEDQIERFVLSGPRNAAQAIAGIEARDPAGFARIDAPGAYVVGYQSRRSSITLQGARFEKYLATEGLFGIIQTRRHRGESDAEGHEVFSRCAKTLLRTPGAIAESGAEAAAASPIGCPFELVFPADQSAPAEGRALSVVALYQGQPLEGVLIAALAWGAREDPAFVRSGSDGKAEFSIDHEGPWLIKAVHMVEAPESIEADWESFWASLTFEPDGP